jgi:hypothetical protein
MSYPVILCECHLKHCLVTFLGMLEDLEYFYKSVKKIEVNYKGLTK